MMLNSIHGVEACIFIFSNSSCDEVQYEGLAKKDRPCNDFISLFLFRHTAAHLSPSISFDGAVI